MTLTSFVTDTLSVSITLDIGINCLPLSIDGTTSCFHNVLLFIFFFSVSAIAVNDLYNTYVAVV